MLFLIHATYHYTFIAGIFASIKPLLDGSLSVNKVCKNHKGLKLHQEEPLKFFAGIRAGSLDLLICKIWSL